MLYFTENYWTLPDMMEVNEAFDRDYDTAEYEKKIAQLVRHARARNCHLRLTPVNGNCRIEIQDDGRGGGAVEGNGLRGMRERIEALGGTLQRENSVGTRLSIEFPLTQTKENGNR